mgnify:CR=1 FL=1
MPYFYQVDAQVEEGARALGEVWALALAWKTYQVRTQSFKVLSQIISQVIIDMSNQTNNNNGKCKTDLAHDIAGLPDGVAPK